MDALIAIGYEEEDDDGDQGEVASTRTYSDDCGCSLQRFTAILTEIRDEQPAWRARADREMDYNDGNQLDNQTLSDMEAIGMPPIIENVIGPAIDGVLGVEAKTRTDWRVSPDADERNQDVADALNYKLNQAEREAGADRACGEAFASQIKVGIGWVEVSREHDPFRYPYRVRAIHRNEIFWDMRADHPDDMRFLVRRRWTDTDIAVRLFPGKADLIRHSGNGWALFDEAITDDGGTSTDLAMDAINERGWSIEESEWRDIVRQRVCIFEVWTRDWVTGLVMRTPDGRVVEFDERNEAHVAAVAAGVVEPRQAVYSKVRLSWWVGPHKLHDGPSPYSHGKIPYVMFIGKTEDRTRAPFGLIRPMVPMQDAINASESKMQWLLAAKRITQTEGATVDDEETVRQEAARPDAHFVLDAQKMRDGGIFKVESDFTLSQQQYQRLQDKRESIKRVSGIYDAFLGQSKGGQSGMALNTLVEQASQTLADIMDNYRDARARVGDLLLSLLIEDMAKKPQQVAIKATMPGEEDRLIVLNEPFLDEETGMQMLNNDVQRTRLKVALNDVPSTSSYRGQQLMMMTEVTKSLPPEFQAIMLPFVLMLTDVPNRDDIIKAIKGATGGESITMQQAQQMVAEAVQQAMNNATLQAERMRLELDRMDLKIKAFAAKSKAHTDNLRAEADWLRAETDAANSNTEGVTQ